MNQVNKNKVRAGATLLIIAPLVFLVIEAIVASFWENPIYSYVTNYVSDLGVPLHTEFQGRLINSPLSSLMNLGFILYADLFVFAISMVAQILPNRRKKASLTLSVLYGLGITFVGIFPGYNWSGVFMHVIGAMLVIFGGNIAIIMNGGLIKQVVKKNWYGMLSIFFGVLGLIGISIVIILTSNNIGYQGLFERIAIYPMFAWEMITGVLLLVENRKKYTE